MGRKSRAKKHQKEWARRSPDEVWTNGALRIEQFGNFTHLVNISTPEQHAASLDNAKIAFREVVAELEREVVGLQALVGKYDAIDIMHRAAYEIMPLLMKYASENEFAGEEARALPAVEYLQYLIARTEPKSDGRATSEAEWEALWGQAVMVFDLTLSYLMLRKTRSQPPSEMDELRLILDSRRLGVRVKGYPFFHSAHWRSAFLPYEQEIGAAYGISVDELIHGLKNIDRHLVFGVPDRYRAVLDATSTLMNRMCEKGYAVEPNASPEEIARTKDALEAAEFKALHEEMQERWRLTFTSALFDITDISALPRSILNLLSVRPGESVLTSLTGPDHDDLSPLSTSILHYKPFLQYCDRFYSFYHSGFDDHVGDIIEADLFEMFSSQVPEMIRRRADRLEGDAKDLLSSVIRPKFRCMNAYYPNPDGGGLTELDIILGTDDLLFLVEAKAGSFSAGAKRGAPDSIAKEFSELIIEGQRQSERAEKYIKSAGEVAFFDSTGKNEILRIVGSHFRRMFRIIVTRENLGWVGARIASLSMLDPHLSRSYPWHVSVDDLRVIAELFKSDEIRFVHYLEQRLSASAETSLIQNDELEHIGLYNSRNMYHRLPFRGVDRTSFDASYMQDINHYFVGRYLGESPPLPTQKMPSRMREFIDALRLSGVPHRFEAGSLVLSMDSDGRGALEDALDALDVGRGEGRQRSTRMPFIEQKIGLTISYAAGANWEEELRNSTVQMEVSNCNRWLAVQLTDMTPYKISAIEALCAGGFAAEELSSAKLQHDFKVRERIARDKPSRNDPCPCLSGKKFKRCHGK